VDGKSGDTFRVHVQLFAQMLVIQVSGELLRATTVSFSTFRGPLTNLLLALQGASIKWSMFVFLLFAKSCLGVVRWFIDNRNLPSIIRNGSMKPDLQRFFLCIFKVVLRNNIDLQVDWIPRFFKEHSATISRVVDFDDWGVSFEFFNYIDNIWGPHSVDRFANSHNRKITQVLFSLLESGLWGCWRILLWLGRGE